MTYPTPSHRPHYSGHNMACMNPHCYLTRREGHYFCTPCYRDLPKEIQSALWSRQYSEASKAVQAAKVFFRRKFDELKAKMEAEVEQQRRGR